MRNGFRSERFSNDFTEDSLLTLAKNRACDISISVRYTGALVKYQVKY